MSHHHLRTDKSCQNCGHEVPERFCTFCGQENIESRQSFGHLVAHFFEDLTHYEGRFWKTMLYLIGRPAYLTKAYLAGKRNSFVPPVRLYFFISFVTFLLPHFLPEGKSEKQNPETRQVSDSTLTIQNRHADLLLGDEDRDYRFLREMDSVEQTLPAEERMDPITKWLQEKRIASTHYSKEEKSEKISSAILNNFPKALFIYLPLFALVLWIFHGKKKWLYFDHAIFTIHYFCFMMLIITVNNILMLPFDLLASASTNNYISGITGYGMSAWFIYYFFRAHRKMYHESWGISTLKSSLTFVINAIVFLMILIGLVVVAISTIH